ncbi:unnamed protein product, partial [Prorocentrum cordatum]
RPHPALRGRVRGLRGEAGGRAAQETRKSKHKHQLAVQKALRGRGAGGGVAGAGHHPGRPRRGAAVRLEGPRRAGDQAAQGRVPGPDRGGGVADQLRPGPAPVNLGGRRGRPFAGHWRRCSSGVCRRRRM